MTIEIPEETILLYLEVAAIVGARELAKTDARIAEHLPKWEADLRERFLAHLEKVQARTQRSNGPEPPEPH